MTTLMQVPSTTTRGRYQQLSPDDLSRVVDRVTNADHEHGLEACFAVADVLGLSPTSTTEPTALVADNGFTRLRDIYLAVAQWTDIARAIHDSAERIVPGGSVEVLDDWATFGPRVLSGEVRI